MRWIHHLWKEWYRIRFILIAWSEYKEYDCRVCEVVSAMLLHVGCLHYDFSFVISIMLWIVAQYCVWIILWTDGLDGWHVDTYYYWNTTLFLSLLLGNISILLLPLSAIPTQNTILSKESKDSTFPFFEFSSLFYSLILFLLYCRFDCIGFLIIIIVISSIGSRSRRSMR